MRSISGATPLHTAGAFTDAQREEGFFQRSGLTSVDDIAEAAILSPRTYNIYSSSREKASAAAERDARVAASVGARPVSVPLADAVT